MLKSKSKQHTQRKFKKLPLDKFTKGVFIAGLVSLAVFIIMIISPEFSDFYNRYIGSAIRGVLAFVTSPFPFSFAELILILLIPAAVLLMVIAAKHYCDSWAQVFTFTSRLVAFLVLFGIVYVGGFGAGYHTTSLDKKLGLEKSSVSSTDLRQTADILTELVNAEAENIDFGDSDFSVMPYSLKEMNDKLISAYGKACELYSFIPKLYSRVKPVAMSELMSYTHITGVYSFFTGEANINVAFPDYTIPFTAAHELAHQRGIAREDEANFVAFLVCTLSDDSYIRYSGYLNLLEYVTSAYYRADTSKDKAEYTALRRSLDEKIRLEQAAYSEFFDKYRDSIASEVSSAVNDTYLQLQGTPGEISYGMVVDLAVAYYKK